MTLIKNIELLGILFLATTCTACDSSSNISLTKQDMALVFDLRRVPDDLRNTMDFSRVPDLIGAATVQVGPSGTLAFSPQVVNIAVDETVTWLWMGSGHNVVSGTGGVADSKFCSPSNVNCATTPTSNFGASYSYTFHTAGTFPYFCQPHFVNGMTGIIIVN